MSTEVAMAKSYDVGYGRPPTHTRFQPGQSGNSLGRPRAKKNLPAVLLAALNERVVVTENGERTTVTKLVAMFKQVVNKAAGGDFKAIKLLTSLLEKFGDLTQTSRPIFVISGADARL